MNVEFGRFTLRDFLPADAPELFKLTGNPETMRYMGFRTHKSVQETEKLITQYAVSHTKFFAICAENELIGVAGFEIHNHQATIMIMFRRGTGAGREFSVPFVKWIFTHKQIWRVWAYVHPDNVATQRVLERMGATMEGKLKRFAYFPNTAVAKEPQDVYGYSIVRD